MDRRKRYAGMGRRRLWPSGYRTAMRRVAPRPNGSPSRLQPGEAGEFVLNAGNIGICASRVPVAGVPSSDTTPDVASCVVAVVPKKELPALVAPAKLRTEIVDRERRRF